MIVTKEVKNAMDEQPVHLLLHGMTKLPCLAHCRVQRYNYIAQEFMVSRKPFPLLLREGKDISGPVEIPVGAVERTDLRIIGDEDTELRVTPVQVA